MLGTSIRKPAHVGAIGCPTIPKSFGNITYHRGGFGTALPMISVFATRHTLVTISIINNVTHEYLSA